MPNGKKHKVTVELPAATFNRLHKTIPWGLRNHLFAALVEMVLDSVEKRGQMVLGALMAGRFEIRWIADEDESSAVQNLDNG